MEIKLSRYKLWLIFISAFLLAFFILGALFFKDSTYGKLAIMTEIIQLVKNNYVDEVDLKKLFNGAFNGLMEGLDTESAYLTKDEYKHLKLLYPNRYGLYIAQPSYNSLIIVTRVTPDSVAYKAGVRAGAPLISINEHYIGEVSLFQARYLLSTEQNKLRLSFFQDKSDKEYNLELKPGKAILEKPFAKVIEGDFGYINIPHFLKGVSEQVLESIDFCRTNKAKGLILDLRNNCFGSIDEALKIADFFLENDVILRLKTKKDKEKLFRAKKENTDYRSFLSILVNAQTLGPSEILTAAIKDKKRGSIIGEKTFGLGVEHSFIELPSGAALRIPWGKCFTPQGKQIQYNGVEPDVVILSEQKAPIIKSKKEVANQDVDEQLNRALIEIKKLYSSWIEKQKK
jgi:carboxyl-terminal processing protease